jgi:hypothetical protein
MSRVLVVAAIASLLSAGCVRDAYLLEITPDEDGFHRRLTVWRVAGLGDQRTEIRPVDAGQLEHLRQIYGSSPIIGDDSNKHVFEGRFSGTMPADIGGYGSWMRYESPLGSVTGYSERFRGSDDLQQQLADRHVAVDRLIELAGAWLRCEMNGDPHLARVEEFLNEELRRDLKNLAVSMWLYQQIEAQSDDASEELAYRLWQYFQERSYWRPADLPRFTTAVAAVDKRPEELLHAVRRILARKTGIPDDQPVPESWAFLADAGHVQRSLEMFLSQTDEYRQALECWRQKHPDASEPDAPGAIDSVVAALVFPIIFGKRQAVGADHLEVRLNTGCGPCQTNGQWDAQEGRVTWQHRPDASPLPAFSYALWSEPDTAAQQAHFGRTLLTGLKLAQYVLWYNDLDRDQAEAWAAFLQACDGGPQLRARIKAFRFPQEDSALSDFIRTLLLDALDAEPTCETTGTQPGSH